MQLQSSGWLSHHGIWAIIRVHIPCSPNINGNCTCLLKIKNKLKIRLFLQIKFGKNSQCFVGVFNQAIIINPLCLLLDMRMIIANSVLCTSLAIYHRTVTKSRGPGDVLRLQWAWAPATFIGTKGKIELKELPFCTIPLLYCMYPATWNFSDSPVPSHIQRTLMK